ncbi:hypothetical protein IMG5_165190 [Ichthyophthirius multifiliis]|uniref:Transmembrane protein n=1 Tax=Ichthyophthirius multifiliis TaxID=5932 RepID=G0R0J8_ICHMU|nr:hypothetical protein IMG5_165190 [Ichthyophthirius multifiliis]EGR29010.1 hypothetical protein IMG5_165190 [Ichthyophthirius multifiliis]|eukprot:XP_004030246.1 hypothetical protein IMG5_165190 [Ichthyophthirius multifiliis]
MLSNIYNQFDIQDSQNYILSGIVGSFTCIILGFLVNACLLEITFNIIFAFYFGMVLILFGFFLINSIFEYENDIAEERKPFVFIFSCIIILSGLFCFFLEERWFVNCVICIVDFFNFLLGIFQKYYQKIQLKLQNKQILQSLQVFLWGSFMVLFSLYLIQKIKVFMKQNQNLFKKNIYVFLFLLLLDFFLEQLMKFQGQKEIFTLIYFKIFENMQYFDDPFGEEI